MKNSFPEIQVDVKRNNAISVEEVFAYDKILISPGPGLPEESGVLLDILKESVSKDIPVLGVCLGHQGLCMTFGAKLLNHENVYHGVASSIKIIEEDELFYNIPSHFEVGRYHSWSVLKMIFRKT